MRDSGKSVTMLSVGGVIMFNSLKERQRAALRFALLGNVSAR